MSRQNESYREREPFKSAITRLEQEIIAARLRSSPKQALEVWKKCEPDLPVGVRYAPPVILALMPAYTSLLRGNVNNNKNELRDEIIDMLEQSLDYITAGRGTVQATGRELAKLYQELGQCLLHTDPVRAAFYLKKSKGINPSDKGTIALLATAYRDSGQLEEARELYQQALAADPDNPQLMLRLAQLLLMEGEFEQAEDILKRAQKIVLSKLNDTKDPHHKESHARRAGYIYQELVNIELERGNHSAAQALHQEILMLAAKYDISPDVFREHALRELLDS